MAILAALMLGLLMASPAQAAPGCSPETSECPPFLTQFGSYGSGAGQLANPRGIATDPDTGHIFVAEIGGEAGQPRVSDFDAQWEFVKAWGWGVRDGVSEPQVCTTQTGCLAGVEGAGPGQFASGLRLAVDQAGYVWVLERANLRVQKFSSEGELVLMVGGEVNKTRVAEREEQEANAEPVTVTEAEENFCAAASGDVCGIGTSGTGEGQFKVLGEGNSIAAGPDGTIYVGDENRIQKFDETGAYLGSIPLPGAGTTRSLTVDPSGRIYVISDKVLEKISNGLFLQDSRVVREIGPAGEEFGRLKGQWEGRTTPKDPVAVAADAEGNVYVVGKVVYDVPVDPGKDPKWEQAEEVVAFDDQGSLISFEPNRAGFGRPTDGSELISLATNVVGDDSGSPGEVLVGHFFNGGLSGKPYLSYARVYGTPFEAIEGAPTIEDQHVTSVAYEQATVEALINPHQTTDTTYQVQYGTGKCSEGGCGSLAPTSPAQLGGGAVNSALKTGPVALGDLEAGTTYHYRFVAQNEAGGPVFGTEGTFRTYITAPRSCPNDALRPEVGALLPDCRAYEMVSPIDKEGGEVIALTNIFSYPATFHQAAEAGNGITYSSYRAFNDPEAAPYTSQYLARRGTGGWSTEAISPRREGVLFSNLDTQYKGFTGNLSQSWLLTDSEPVLAPGGLAGYRNLYLRDNDSRTYQAQCAVGPPEAAAAEFRLEPQAYSVDWSHLVFRANDKLTPDAATGDITQLYECVNGTELRLVSVLPGGEASSTGASAGTARGDLNETEVAFREGNVVSSVSSDGSRIFWTADPNGPGPLYVRIDGSSTVQISTGLARFHTASPDGSRVIYSVEDESTLEVELFEANVGNPSVTSNSIADEVEGFMGTSEDARLVYFVSREDLDGGGSAEAGEPNLYLYRAQGDAYTFIATLSEKDARETFNSDEGRPVLTPVAISPYNRSARITPDGLHAAFTSTAPLTGFDNTDQASEEADAEVFVYDAAAGELVCASCNPGGARPKGANVGQPTVPFWAAAKIPGWENQMHASRALSEDGSRVFFEAADTLSPEDVNNVQDVYQWEAVGTGGCTVSYPTYSAANGGCVDLISSGKSTQPSKFVDASPSGDDVFFKTASSLWPSDPGLVDVYDARVGGGFPPLPAPRAACEGGDCRAPGPAPANSAPGTAVFVGPGDPVVRPKKKPRRCRKGTHRVRKAGKVRCVKNRKQGKRQTRRAGR